MRSKIHSFPASLQGVGERYIRPKLVTIGPYHNETEIKTQERDVRKMKEAAVHSFVGGGIKREIELASIQEKIETMFKKVSLYWHTGDAIINGVTGDPPPVQERVDVHSLYDKYRVFGHMDFRKTVDHHARLLAMMFQDGCFILQFICACTNGYPELPEGLEDWFDVNKSLICNDIMLLENQLPWVVLETLNNSRPESDRVPLKEFVAKLGRSLEVRSYQNERPFPDPKYKPPHLLGFLWHYKTGGSIPEPVSPVGQPKPISPNLSGLPEFYKTGGNIQEPKEKERDGVGQLRRPMSKTMSVIELADIGIYLTSSEKTKFKDMGFTWRSWFIGPGQISLAPLLLDEVTSCWLVNMAAFEVCIATLTRNRDLCSYLALLAMLMDGEQDVHELRANRMVQGDLTNKETLDFFKTLVKHIRPGHQYFHIMEDVESYRVSRFIWIILHSLLYNSFSKRSFKYNYTKTIMTTIGLFAVVVAMHKVIFILENRPT